MSSKKRLKHEQRNKYTLEDLISSVETGRFLEILKEIKVQIAIGSLQETSLHNKLCEDEPTASKGIRHCHLCGSRIVRWEHFYKGTYGYMNICLECKWISPLSMLRKFK